MKFPWHKKRTIRLYCCLLGLSFFFLSCFRVPDLIQRETRGPAAPVNNPISGTGTVPELTSVPEPGPEQSGAEREIFIDDFWANSLGKADLPDDIRSGIINSLGEGPDFVMELLTILEGDPFLYILVDKQHSLDQNYVPEDLAELGSDHFRVSREGLMLRRAAILSMETMAAAARTEGINLIAASAFRSWDYQAEVYNRNVREMGQTAADRESARPGHSQHQLGLALDFFPIDDSFANTPAALWLLKNSSRFGWSLSYPEAYEPITGYRWESWHYRYLGPDLSSFTEKYFKGIQQYCLEFISAWLEADNG